MALRTSIQDLSSVVSRMNHRGDLFAAMIHDVLSASECQQLIDRSEEVGYENALVNVGNGRQIAMEDVRNSDRCIIDDPDFAELLYQRLLTKLESEPSLLNPLVNWKMEGKQHAVGLNERLRILRYDPGCYFRPHSDGCYIRGFEAGLDRRGERSEVTLLLYLNDDYQGGYTRLLDYKNSQSGHSVLPKAGSVLLFEHPCLHEGATLEAGQKYVVRTDIMYTRKGPGYEYSTKGLQSSSSK